VIAKQDLLFLKTKILPTGAEAVLDYLTSKLQQVEMTHIVLENVPLLIIGRHGMIARIPNGGTLQKVSHPQEILEQLRLFFQRQETLYLFTNLPDLPVPTEVTQVLEEIERRHEHRQELLRQIDEALEQRNRESFLRASAELNRLRFALSPGSDVHKRISFR